MRSKHNIRYHAINTSEWRYKTSTNFKRWNLRRKRGIFSASSDDITAYSLQSYHVRSGPPERQSWSTVGVRWLHLLSPNPIQIVSFTVISDYCSLTTSLMNATEADNAAGSRLSGRNCPVCLWLQVLWRDVKQHSGTGPALLLNSDWL